MGELEPNEGLIERHPAYFALEKAAMNQDIQSHEMGSLLGHAKRIELKYTEQEKEHYEHNIVYQKPLWTRFEMEIRTSDYAASEPDFIIKGNSSDSIQGQADVIVIDKSGKAIMTITRAARKKQILAQLQFETAHISMPTGETGSYDNTKQSLVFCGTEYTSVVTNPCGLCPYILGSFLCFFPTLGMASCYFMGKVQKYTTKVDFKDNGLAIGNHSEWLNAAPFKNDDDCCATVPFETLMSVDMSDQSQWTVTGSRLCLSTQWSQQWTAGCAPL